MNLVFQYIRSFSNQWVELLLLISSPHNPTVAWRISRRWHPSCSLLLMGEAVMSDAICGGCYQCAFSGQCVLPIFSACPWFPDMLVVLISRSVRHFLLRVIYLEWSYCLVCQPSVHGEDDWGEVRDKRQHLDFCPSKGTRFIFDQFLNLTSFSCMRACRMLCLLLLSPDRLIFCGLFCLCESHGIYVSSVYCL